MTQNYFQGTTIKPYHLSIGAVVVNKEGKVCCHYFKSVKIPGDLTALDDFYILMRETPELDETIVETLNRGLMEEFGITGEVITYIGSIQTSFPRKEIRIEKTTLYFLVNPTEIDHTKRKSDDEERESEIQWHDIDFLISKMKEQAPRLHRDDIDESSILENVKDFLAN